MRGKDHEHKHAAHMHKRAKGGKIKEAGGNPYVEHEAHEDKDGEEAERKHGGKAHHAKEHHGKEHEHKKRKRGGKIEGHHPKHRLDKPGRKRGGRVGADTSPLSSAHATHSPSGQPKTEQGGMSK